MSRAHNASVTIHGEPLTVKAEQRLAPVARWRSLGGFPQHHPYRSIGAEPILGRVLNLADARAAPEGTEEMDLVSLLRARRLLAIVRGRRAEAALDTVCTLADEGVTLIEVSLTSHRALDVITRAREELGVQVLLGVGTVVTAQDARDAHAAGAQFAVTPGLGDGVEQARSLGMSTLVGALTPSEVIAAQAAGADAVKLFPASATGGPGYLRTLRAPFPQVPFVPVGGVDTRTGRSYLNGGATAIGVGSPLIGDAADGGDLSLLRERARAYLRLAEEPGR
ncbi:2-dehydro-3-deoxyphosphogluconate aldolase/(4S)-4-hydroxy-2-oxoglutarate aldolase [Streptacidiphilus sp. MAP5-52]